MLVDIRREPTRICRGCGASDLRVRFYSMSTTAGRAAGHCCRRCWIKRSVRWRRANKESWNRKRHAKRLERQFGITSAQFEAMYADPHCEGCGASKSRRGARLALDHCHATGTVRGLLCADCNSALGSVQDRPNVLRRLADYLERAR